MGGAGDDSVTAVVRALRILDAFGVDDPKLTLADLSRRVGLPKSSALRIARTLKASGYLAQLADGAWRLGPATAWLGARYQVAFDRHSTIEPVVRKLSRATRETASFFVRDGDMRNCLVRVKARESTHRVRIGEPLPLDKGASGQVMLAFSGRKGRLYDEIRQRGYHITVGEITGLFGSIAAPVFGATREVIGSLAVVMPKERATAATLTAHAPALLAASRQLTYALSTGGRKVRPVSSSTW